MEPFSEYNFEVSYSSSKETEDYSYRYGHVYEERFLNSVQCSGVEIRINNSAFTIMETVQVQNFLHRISRQVVEI